MNRCGSKPQPPTNISHPSFPIKSTRKTHATLGVGIPSIYNPPPTPHHTTPHHTNKPYTSPMATKAAVAAALLVAMLALATASAFTENTQPCSMLVQTHRFPACQRFLRQLGDDQAALQPCCQELRHMDQQQCTCEAIRRAVMQAQYGLSATTHLYDRASTLPRRCSLRQQQCRFNLIFV